MNKIKTLHILLLVGAQVFMLFAVFSPVTVRASHPAGRVLCEDGSTISVNQVTSGAQGNCRVASEGAVELCHDKPSQGAIAECIEKDYVPATPTSTEPGSFAANDNCTGENQIETSFDLAGDSTSDDDAICVDTSQSSIENNPIIRMIVNFVQFLSVGVGIAVTISIVLAGIQYISSQGNPQALQAAQSRLANAIIALFLFIFMTTIINFIVPGGVF